MDKSISIGIATLIISIAAGAGVQIAVGVGMITQANAIYFLIGAGVLFLVGISFLVHGIRSRPKAMQSISTVTPQSGAILKTTDSSTHKLIQAIICEIAGMGLIVGGALIAIRDPSEITFLLVGFLTMGVGTAIFGTGIAISR